jgi:hypothetical protein
MIIVAYSGVSSLFAAYPTYALSEFPRMIENCFLFFYAANHVRSKADVHFVVFSVAISVALCGLVGFAQYFTGSSLGLVFLGTAQQQEELRYSTVNLARVSAFLEHPNNLAWFLISWLPLLLVWVIGGLGSRTLRAMCGVAFVLGSLTLVITYSRAGWIGMFLSVLCIGLYLGYKRILLRSTNRYFARYVIVCLIGIVLSLPLASGMVARVVEFDKGAAYARIPKIRAALQVIHYNWITGVGMGNYAYIVRKYDPGAELYPPWRGGLPLPVHNIYLHILAELGIATLALFAWVTLVCVRQARRCLRSVDGIVECFALGLLGGLAAFLVEGMTQPGTLQDPTFRTWWFLCGLFMGLGLLTSQEDRASALRQKVQ